MSGISDLDELLRTMRPEARADEYVIVTLPSDPGVPYAALIREDEGITLVVKRDDADAAGIPYDFVAGWITLMVHSDFAAVGFTAAFSTALADEGISCNVLAGFHHDHLLVPFDRLDDALVTLGALAQA